MFVRLSNSKLLLTSSSVNVTRWKERIHTSLLEPLAVSSVILSLPFHGVLVKGMVGLYVVELHITLHVAVPALHPVFHCVEDDAVLDTASTGI